jgi:serine protease Do
MRIGILSLVSLAAIGLAASSAFAQNPRPPAAVTVQRAGTSYLGIGVWEIDADRARALNLKDVRGAEVKTVDEDGPSAKAGIKEGDVVLQFNNEPVEGVEQFIRMVHETPPGRQVKLTIWRNGTTQTVTVTVGERRGTLLQTPNGSVTIPPIPPIPPIPQFDIPHLQMSGQSQMLGIEGEPLGDEPQLAEYFGVQDGVLVKRVIKNSPAEKAGIKAGDVIIRVEGSKVGTTRDITSQLRSARTKRTVGVAVVRDKKENSLSVTFDERSSNNPPAPGERF